MNICFLRGINLGGKKRLGKSELIRSFELIGIDGVKVYLQSGNVLYSSEGQLELPQRIEGSIFNMTGLRVKAVVRSHKQMREVVNGCPFSVAQTRKTAESAGIPVLHVVFFPNDIEGNDLNGIRKVVGEGEEFKARGSELYLLLPNGVSKSKMPQYVLRLHESATMRNWNTVEKILEIMNNSE